MKTVMVSGKFDPPHEGHIDHVMKASKLGDFLIVVVQTDEAVRAVKGKCEVPLWGRIALMRGILNAYHINGEVHIGIDSDGKSVKSLAFFRPNVYAKGGDRTPQNMSREELDLCNEIGCERAWGVGDLLNSSSKMEIRKEES